jgi:hypothetical protein
MLEDESEWPAVHFYSMNNIQCEWQELDDYFNP